MSLYLEMKTILLQCRFIFHHTFQSALQYLRTLSSSWSVVFMTLWLCFNALCAIWITTYHSKLNVFDTYDNTVNLIHWQQGHIRARNKSTTAKSSSLLKFVNIWYVNYRNPFCKRSANLWNIHELWFVKNRRIPLSATFQQHCIFEYLIHDSIPKRLGA